MNKYKYIGFTSELEKYAGLTSALFKFVPKKWLAQIGKWAGEAKGLSGSINYGFNVTKDSKAFKTGVDAVKSAPFSAKNLTGTMGRKLEISGIKEAPAHVPFFKHPDGIVAGVKNMGMNVVRKQSAHLEHLRKYGLRDLVKTEFKNSQYFTKNVKGVNGKNYNIKIKRSIPGRLANPIMGTGVGWGGMEFFNKTDDKGRKLTYGQRGINSAKEALKWTIGGPVMGAKMMAYDMPKMVAGSFGF